MGEIARYIVPGEIVPLGAAPRRAAPIDAAPRGFDEDRADAEFGAAEALQRAMRVDPVTQLPNRRKFIEDFGYGLPSTPRGDSDVLVMLTLTEASQFNGILRALGHSFAEEFVRLGADRLRKVLPDSAPLYHISLLSFAFPMQVFSGDIHTSRIEDILRVFEEPVSCAGIPIRNRVGIGLTYLDEHSAEPSELLRGALVAAQDSRHSAEGWAWYDSRSDRAHLRAFRLLADLGRLIEKPDEEAQQQLSLHYQPRIDLGDGQCTGAEALMRWTHPQFGFVSPAEFIPLAEATALITPLSRWVVKQCVAQQAMWQREGLSTRVSMNVAPSNLAEADFAEFLIDTCHAQRVDPASIEIEFTESAMTTDDVLTLEHLTSLRMAGVRVAIDDFGSGYSNMRYLRSIPADVLKIDKDFVLTLDTCDKNRKIVPTIIDLGHRLGFDVVAEGIETRTAYESVSRWGCDEGQGFFMSKPLPEPVFREWFAARARAAA